MSDEHTAEAPGEEAGEEPSEELSGEEIDEIVERELSRTPEGGAKRCPECSSSDLYTDLGGYTGQKYHCKACGYMGTVVVEGEEP